MFNNVIRVASTSAAAPGRIIRDASEAHQIAAQAKTVAVLGIKPETKSDQPAFYVPQYLKASGKTVIPIPTYFPQITEILGETVYRAVKDVPGPIDILDVFRRPEDLDSHLEDILAKQPKIGCVWLQSGISNAAFEQRLAEQGINVVVSRCLMVDLRSLGAGAVARY